MADLPPLESRKRKLHSFEIDSLEWWKRSGIWIVSIFVVVVSLARPPGPRGHRKNAVQTQAINNARQIGIALEEFKNRFGKYPDADTIKKVRQETGTDLEMGAKSSNDFLRQLLAAELTWSENMFYSKIHGSHEPDGILTGATALAKGECGFTYLAGTGKIGNPNRPLLVTPMIPGTDRFDPEPFKGKAVILKMDNSVTSLNISPKNGHVMLDGRNLMDPSHPVWEGNPPVIAWPDM